MEEKNNNLHSENENISEMENVETSKEKVTENNEIEPKQPSEASFQNYQGAETYGAQPFQVEKPKKNKKKLWFLIGGIACIAIILLLVLSGIFARKTKVDKLLEASFNSYNIHSMEYYQEFGLDNINVEEEAKTNPFLAQLKNLNFKLNSKVDKKALKNEAKIKLGFNDIEFLDMFYQQENMDFILSIPKLFNKPIYISKEGLEKVIDENAGKDSEKLKAIQDTFTPEKLRKAFQEYAPVVNPMKLNSFKKLNQKKYTGRIKDYYNEKIQVEKGTKTLTINGEEKEFKGDVYSLKENLGQIVEFNSQLLKDLLNDENFKPFLDEYITQIINQAEKSKDIVLYNYICLLTGTDELKTAWDNEVKEELIYQKELLFKNLDLAKEELNKPSAEDKKAKIVSALKEGELNLNLEILVDGVIKYYRVSMDSDFEKLNSAFNNVGIDNERIGNVKSFQYYLTYGLLETGSAVKFEEFDKEKALDFLNASDSELNQFTNEVRQNILKLVMSSFQF